MMKAILHRKGEDGVWTTETYSDKQAGIELESINVSLVLSDIYEKIDF